VHAEVVGSNPSPGAYFEEPSTSLKALTGDSRVEIATTNMDGLTESKTRQKKQTTTTTTTTTTATHYQLLPYRVAMPYLCTVLNWNHCRRQSIQAALAGPTTHGLDTSTQQI
jgi:hypothetical protein